MNSAGGSRGASCACAFIHPARRDISRYIPPGYISWHFNKAPELVEKPAAVLAHPSARLPLSFHRLFALRQVSRAGKFDRGREGCRFVLLLDGGLRSRWKIHSRGGSWHFEAEQERSRVCGCEGGKFVSDDQSEESGSIACPRIFFLVLFLSWGGM